MALNFPDSPTIGDIYTDNVSGFSYQWDGVVWQSYTPSATKNITLLDDISGSFNDSNTIFPITVSGVAFTPANAQQLRIVLGGVVQDPANDYSVSGTNLIFSTPPTTGLTFSGVSLGPAVPVGVSTIGDVYNRQTYAPTGIQTSFSFLGGYTVGYLDVYQNGVRLSSGTDFTATDGLTFDLTTPADTPDELEAIGYKVSTITITEGQLTNLFVTNNAAVLGITTLGTVGSAGTTLLVHGDARVTGILTVGSSSVTIDGTNNTIAVGSSITIDGNTGIITGAVFYGDGSNLTGVSGGIGTEGSINTSGIVTAGKVVASTFEGSGDNLIFSPSPLSYSPGIAETGVTPVSDIVVTFDQQVQSGVGTVTLRTVSAGGTIAESFTVGSSSSITFSNNTVTLNPTGFLDSGTVYYAVFPQGTVQNYLGGNALEINSYYFETSEAPVATTFSPAVGVVTDAYAGNIEITYDQPITANSGTITLRTGSRTGTIVESFDVTTDVTIVSDTLTINPTNDLNAGLTYYVVIPAGAITNNIGLSVVDGQLDYYFTTNAALFSWGQNSGGQLAQNNTIEYSSPVQIPGTQWSSISGGSNHSLTTKTDGTLWSWGYNFYGQLGQNNTANYSSPIQIPGTQWSSMSGNQHSMATKTDGTLWAWGRNAFGQLGQNNTTEYSSPVQIPGTSWSSIDGGSSSHSMATKTDGTLWSWGYNVYGQLGQNNTTRYSSPVQIPGTSWSSISGGLYHSLATKTDGTLWAWGYNPFGQLGQNNTTYYSSPVQIPGTSWSSIDGGSSSHSMATKTDGTLWGWGNNAFGQLGQNNTIRYSSPVQIPGTQWSSIGSGNQHSIATKTDGTLWGWGDNSEGHLGQNNQIRYSSPVQIPGTSWSSIDGGLEHSLATQKI